MMTRAERNWQAQRFRRLEAPPRPIPRLTARERRALTLIMLDWPRRQAQEAIATAVLRALIAATCIEVMALSPARYRVTKLGLVARSLAR